MTDSVSRFSDRAENYAKYRPAYPPGVIDILKANCGLTQKSVIADIGSGTGILTELFLKHGNFVFAVEPNAAMRSAAEHFIKPSPNFASVEATAESTTLKDASIDIITAAQAFHWFDRNAAKREFTRILKPGGWVALIWNERRLDSKPFLRAYESLLLRYGTDYEKVRHENVASEVPDFFFPESFELKTLENAQRFDLESLKGRVLSSSYTPPEGQPDFEPMMTELEEVFHANQVDGAVGFEYETKVYFGHLIPAMK
jgi:ubiquinone/menaquinone biosynthesis C-methylase UbiE